MDEITIERIGGLGGFGLPGSHVRSRGSKKLSSLSPADQAAVDRLFDKGGGGAAEPRGAADSFRYRITRQTAKGPQTVEVPAAAVPEALSGAVKDELI